MKILINCNNLRKGGTERVINIISNELIKENDIMIVTQYNNTIDYSFSDKITIKTLGLSVNKIFSSFKRLSPFTILKLKKIIIEFKPDVILSFLPEPNFRVLFLKKYNKIINNIPIIISVRNDPNIEYSNFLRFYIMRKLYPLSNQIVLQTNDAKEYFLKHINYNGEVICNPVSNLFIKKRYSGVRDKRIVAVGRLYEQKNYFNMIDSFSIVSEKHNDYIFEIYGDGILKNKIQNYINNKNLQNKVFLRGIVDNISDKIYKASAFVMSSDYEGMPNSLLEAACLGLPCVSTDCPCGGPREILKNGLCGILVEVNNSIDLANGLLKILSDNDFAEKIGTYSNNNANEYSIDMIIMKWKSLIDIVIKNNFHQNV